MRTVRIRMRQGLLLLTLLASACGVRAQEPTETAPPKPAARAIPLIGDVGNPQDQETGGTWQPDTTPLTGLQSPTLGRVESPHSYIQPGAQYGANVQSRPGSTGGSSDWYLNNYFGVSLSLLKDWSRSQLALNYSAGGFVSTDSQTDNGWYQQMGAGQNFQFERWQVQWSDQFSYLPETSFGFGGGTGLGLPGVGGPLGPPTGGTGGSTTPNQSIYTAAGPRYSNSLVLQTTYLLTRRSSLTASGSIGLLRFTQAGNVDSNNYTGSLGYNYALNRQDTLGVVYRFSSFHYDSQPQAIGDQIISVAYGRKITQKLALQLLGGPEITSYRIAIGGNTQRISGSVTANLSAALKNGGLSLNYFHGLGGGSGILVGSDTDQITFGASRRISRIWSAHANVGFSRNRPVGNVTGSTSYNDWYAGGGVDRPIGRNLDFSAAYTARIETPTNQATSTQHVVTLFISWHSRPFVLP